MWRAACVVPNGTCLSGLGYVPTTYVVGYGVSSLRDLLMGGPMMAGPMMGGPMMGRRSMGGRSMEGTMMGGPMMAGRTMSRAEPKHELVMVRCRQTSAC